jgi:hypothetical protein
MIVCAERERLAYVTWVFKKLKKCIGRYLLNEKIVSKLHRARWLLDYRSVVPDIAFTDNIVESTSSSFCECNVFIRSVKSLYFSIFHPVPAYCVTLSN